MGARAFDAVLLDIDGVLAVSWTPIPGAPETFSWLRAKAIPFRLVTNTTTHTRADLADTLRSAGFDVEPSEIVTAVVATGAHLRAEHPDARVFLLSDGDARADLQDIRFVDAPEDAEVVVMGGAFDGFGYETINRIFRALMEGASLVGMHRNLYWRTSEGWQLDGGAYIAGLEEATARRATICGKPAPAYFHAATRMLGADPRRSLMVGDDVENDVLGAQAAGLTGALVHTGKFRQEDLDRASGRPDHQLGSIADLPTLLGRP